MLRIGPSLRLPGFVANALVLALLVGGALALGAAPSHAQSNDDDYTPLNSRIKRDRQFPLEPPSTWDISQRANLNKKRSKAMMGQFARCLYKRSNEKSLRLIEQTDLGFVDFGQTDFEPSKVARIFGFQDCLGRVAEANNSGVVGRFSAGTLRQWLLQEAYFDRFPDEPGWVRPGYVIAERTLPLSPNDSTVRAILEFSDCVVASDPYGADYFYRTGEGSEDELPALRALVPAIQQCLPDGRQMEIQPAGMRVWIGEGLWQAANHSVAAPPPEQ